MSENKRGRKPRTNDVISVGFELDAKLWARVLAMSEKLGISRKRIIERALQEYFDGVSIKALEDVAAIVDAWRNE